MRADFKCMNSNSKMSRWTKYCMVYLSAVCSVVSLPVMNIDQLTGATGHCISNCIDNNGCSASFLKVLLVVNLRLLPFQTRS